MSSLWEKWMSKKLHLAPALKSITIKDNHAQLRSLDISSEFSWAQRILAAEIERQHNAGKPVRIIVLKARQLGISTLTEAVLFWWCFAYPGSNHLVLSKDRPSAESIFEMAKLMWTTWPMRALFSTSRESSKRLSWNETLSNFRVDSARGTEVGRGLTLQGVHASEVAFWEEADSVIGSLGPALPYKPGTIMVMESTANGVGGFFYDEWRKACRGENDYTPLFFPWWRHFDYSLPNHSLKDSQLTQEETHLREFIWRHYETRLTLGQLAWRRMKIRTDGRGDPAWFSQEYPSWPDEAFLSTGRNVFPLESLDDCFWPPGEVSPLDRKMVGITRGELVNDNGKLVLAHDRQGNLCVFKLPGPREEYVVAADPARTSEGDPCCIQVINRATLEQVAVWHGWATQDVLAQTICNLGYFYNEAIVNCEIEGGGSGVIAVMQHIGYPKIWRWRRPDAPLHKRGNVFGWSTNVRTKRWAMGELVSYIYKRAVTIHDRETYEQMRTYQILDGIEMGPASASDHDDAVSAFAIAMITNITEDPPDFENIYQIGPRRPPGGPHYDETEPIAFEQQGYRDIGEW